MSPDRTGKAPATAVVFGGSGFIGGHLIKFLAAQGAKVVCADIAKPEALPDGATYQYCDITKPITLERERPFEAIFNLAAIHRTPGHETHEYYEVNVGGAHNIVEWMDAGGERLLVFTSSISIYGPSEELKTEISEPAPASDYGFSKLIAEDMFRAWRGRDDRRRLVITRPAVVFGQNERGNFTRLARALRKKRFAYPGRKDTIKCCGYVNDLVRALLFCADRAEPEILFNYCYPRRSTIEEICEAFHVVAGYERPRMVPPALMGAVMKTLKTINPQDKGNVNAARVAKLTASTNVAVDVLQQMGFEWQTDIESALRIWHNATDTFV
jgi:GlcNAc-P-P-Und epimerase